MQLSTLLPMFAVLLLPLLPLFRAWTLWLGIEGKLAVGMRKALFTVGIASISVACLGGWRRY